MRLAKMKTVILLLVFCFWGRVPVLYSADSNIQTEIAETGTPFGKNKSPDKNIRVKKHPFGNEAWQT